MTGVGSGTVVPNPSVETVMGQVVDAIRKGAGMPIDDDAIYAFKNRYRQSFTDRLQDPADPGSWDRDQKNVLAAATEHGVISAAIARLNKAKRIDKSTLVKAGNVVEVECHINFKQGMWCS